ncbi:MULTISPECIES: hypothetical protein [Nonomuraea]|uniref:Uncharacterized protein n=1 Tax=Nonomuraea mangrovi TaxID=2316207 RepID=A0ABW4T711_9ACTN
MDDVIDARAFLAGLPGLAAALDAITAVPRVDVDQAADVEPPTGWENEVSELARCLAMVAGAIGSHARDHQGRHRRLAARRPHRRDSSPAGSCSAGRRKHASCPPGGPSHREISPRDRGPHGVVQGCASRH